MSMSVMRWAGVVGAVVTLVAAPTARGQATEDRGSGGSQDQAEASQRDIRIEAATEPLLRNAGLAFGGSQLVQSGLAQVTRPLVGEGVEGNGGWGIAARAAWVLFVDVPVADWCLLPNHELGHALRRPAGAGDYTLKLEGPAWPFLYSRGGSVAWEGQTDTTRWGPWERLRMTAGGWEADDLFLERAREAIYSSRRMHYGDALSYFWAKLHVTNYLLKGTAEWRLTSEDPEARNSDPLIYAAELAEIDGRGETTFDAVSRRDRALRRGAYWNLVDYTFWASAAAWLKGRIVDGRAYSRTPWLGLGPVALAPSASFTLTPYGPETTALTGWRAGGRTGTVYARWTDPLEGSRVVGGGAGLRLASGTLPVERVAADVWRDREGSWGGRLEVSGVWRRSERDRLGLSWRAGVKSRGPLAGFANAAEGYAGVGLSLRLGQ
jgi:hypothetical protein